MRNSKSLFSLAAVLAFGAAVSVGAVQQKAHPFVASGAKYVMKVSAVSSPAIEGFAVGYRIRDALWAKTNGQIFYDYYPLSQLGGEVEVLGQLATGAVQGMLCSSVVAPKVGARMGVMNLPFLVNSFDKLDKFAKDKPLFQHMLDGALEKGIMGIDVSGYGNYGWASTKPIRTIADAKTLTFRIAEADVNQSIYRAWGFNVVSMPWPDVHIALKQRVIGALDHTPSVCSITKKFETAKYFTQVNYAQGLLIHMVNKKWFDGLPKDLQETVVEVIREECAKARDLTRKQEESEIAKAKASGVQFSTLSEQDMATLKNQSGAVFSEWGGKIGKDYLAKVEKLLGYK